jgi:hypothetical protein
MMNAHIAVLELFLEENLALRKGNVCKLVLKIVRNSDALSK